MPVIYSREARYKAMKNSSFTTTFSVDQTPEEVLNAIKNARGWWSEEIEGGTGTLGDEFIYRYKDVHYCKAKLIEVIPGKKVVWLVLDNRFNFTEDESERGAPISTVACEA